jgi:hypothetical protein
MNGQQRKLCDRCKAVVLAPFRYMLILQPVRELPYVIAARDLVTLLNMLEREEFAVTMTHVAHSKVYAGAICGGAQH